MKNRFLLMITLVTVLLFSFTVYADYEYDMYECWWEDQDDNGRILGSWDKCDAATAYKVRLTVGSSKVVKGWYTASSSGSNDFTAYIVKNGTGTYYFDVYPSKGGEKYMICSEGLQVTSAMLSKAKKYVKEKQAEQASQMHGWIKGPDGNWRYYKDGGTACRNEWLNDGGKWYFFDSDSVMQTGWQAINGYWYCFETSGALYTNTVTPDGYTVNGDGVYVDANGSPVPVSGSSSGGGSSSSYTGRTTTLSSISIGVSEKSVEDGKVRTAEFRAASGFDIVSETLSTPREQWAAGTAVSVSLKIVPKIGYQFTSGTFKVSINGASNIQVSGGTSEKTVKFSYKPKMKLAAPDGFCFNENTELTWHRSERASSYKAVFYLDGSQVDTKTVSTNKIGDVYEYLDMGRYEGTVSVKIYAQNTNNSSCILTSNAGVIDDLAALEESMGMGGFTWEGSKLYYYDEFGEKVKGWQHIDNNWYHFKNNGAADGPGWYQDTDGCWYWFDSMCRMCVGTINDGNADYFMNDGSNPNLPYGAWRQ